MKNQKTYESLQVPVFVRIGAVPTDRGRLRALCFERSEG
jgi:hypothetical protein